MNLNKKVEKLNEFCRLHKCDDCPLAERKICRFDMSSEEEVDNALKKIEMFNKISSQEIKDSGDRTEYATGAVRDLKEGKGRCDLMPLEVVGGLLCGDDADTILTIEEFKVTGDVKFLYSCILTFGLRINWGCNEGEVLPDEVKIFDMLLEVSKHFEQGAKKYGEGNWQKGIPVHSYIDSAIRHYLKFCAGWHDEPHDRAFVWNLMCCIWTMEHHPELDDWTEKEEKTNA